MVECSVFSGIVVVTSEQYNHDEADIDLQDLNNLEEEKTFRVLVLLVNCLMNN